ncbi:hypothetical protein L4D06_03060 [Enterovibrio makurazakiensis]|uniref:toxin-antitoxin system YwqK family antitoxin n=1 Tax=Enterovibrio makurazakiensis TaxID=2910232 RepID=UPI003D1A8459
MRKRELAKWLFIGVITLAMSLVVVIFIFDSPQKGYAYLPPETPKPPKTDGSYQRYHYDEVLAETGQYLNGELHGEWKSYWYNGKLRLHGSYSHGQPVGLWVEYLSQWSDTIYSVKLLHETGTYSEKKYCESGSTSSLEHYTKDNELTGDYYQFYCIEGEGLAQNTQIEVSKSELKNVKVHANHINGILDGEYLYYHKNMTLGEKRHYNKGSKEGEWIVYDFEGRVTEKGSYLANVKTGVWNTYEEGILLERHEYLTEKRSKYSSYHMNGQPKEQGQYHQDMKVGNWNYFDTQGRLEKQGAFENGVKQGVWLTFRDDNKHIVSSYKRGLRQGDLQEYYPNGNLFFHCTMQNDQCNGQYTIYHENNTVAEKGSFLGGYKEGPVTNYYESGAIYIKANYSRGHFIDYFESYYENGTLESKGHYKSQFGYTDDAYGNSSIIAITGSDHDGDWLYYHDNGQLHRKGSYKYNERINLWYYYDRDGQQTELRFYQTGFSFIRMKDEMNAIPNQPPVMDVANRDYYTLDN